MRNVIRVAAAVLLAIPAVAGADLSGDFHITVRDAQGVTTGQLGKIYLQGSPDSPDRAVRMELRPEGAKNEMVFLSKPAAGQSFMVMPQAKAYVKLDAAKAPQAPGAGKGLKPSDFKTVGTEEVNGIATVVKEAKLHRSDGASLGTARVYVAPDLGGEPVKSVVTTDKGVTTTAVIEHPTTQAVPDDRFRVPAGYTEAKLPSMGKVLEGLGAEAGDEAAKEGAQEKAEQKEKAKQSAKDGLKKLLPF
jgi:hypothetical protein